MTETSTTTPWQRQQAFLAARAPRCSHLEARADQAHIWVPALVQQMVCAGCFTTLRASVRLRMERAETSYHCDHCDAPAADLQHTDLGLLHLVELRCTRCVLEAVGA